MTIIWSSMQAVAVPILVGLLGFAVLRRRLIDGAHLKVLGVLALDIALPCHVLATLLDRFDPHAMPAWWANPLWWLGSVLFFGFMSWAGRQWFAAESRREAAIGFFYPNAVFLPMIVLMELFGSATTYLADLFLFTLFFSMFYFNTIGWFFGKSSGQIPSAGRSNRKRASGASHRKEIDEKDLENPTVPKMSLRAKSGTLDWRNAPRWLNPVLAATVCGVLLKLLRIDWLAPEFVRSGLRLVGAMAAPALLLLLGGNIYMDIRRPSEIVGKDTVVFVFWKNLVIPLGMIGMLLLLRPPPPIALLLLLHAAVPPLTSLPTMAERCGGRRDIIGRFMVASFVAALITVPIFLAALFWMYPDLRP